jgi:hypothetical protein
MSAKYSVFVRFNERDSGDPRVFSKKDSYIGSFAAITAAEHVAAEIDLDKYEFGRDGDDTWTTVAFIFRHETGALCSTNVEMVGDQVSAQKKNDWLASPVGVAHLLRTCEEREQHKKDKRLRMDAELEAYFETAFLEHGDEE